MKVRELIEKLQALPNQEAHVILYSTIDEGMETDAETVKTRTEMEEEGRYPYCKGYHFRELNSENPDLDYVVIL